MFKNIKTFLAVLLVVGITQSADAAKTVKVKVFDCPVKDTEADGVEYTAHVKFALSGLEKGPQHADYEWLDKASAEEWVPVVVEKEEGQTFSSGERLNDNYSVYGRRTQKQITVKGKKKWVEDKKKGVNRVELFGDGDGVDYAYLNLYKDSGYKKGYFKFKADQKENDTYQVIHCEVEDKELEVFEN